MTSGATEYDCCIKANKLKACVSISTLYNNQETTTYMRGGRMLFSTKAQVVESAMRNEDREAVERMSVTP